MKTVKKLLIIDGNSILNRAYYGIRMLTAPDGTPTNAVYGFLNILFKNLEEDSPDYVCVAFDVKEKTFRHKMYDLYKAQRKPAPEDFLVQLPLMKEVLRAMNCVCLEKPGYEADDIIGTVSRICEEQGVECSILTGDKDDLQLASDKVKVKLVISKLGSTTTTVYGADEVYEKYAVTPSEFIDVKGLMGDTSDNIPGVKGIGEKTAFSLIESYKSIDNIYARLDEIEVTPSVRKKLEEGKESAYLSRTLATIDRSVPMDFDIESCAVQGYNQDALSSLFQRLNFKSFMSKLELKAEPVKEELVFDGECKKIDSSKFLDMVKNGGSFVYRLGHNGDLTDIAITDNGKDFYCVDDVDVEVIKGFFESSLCKKIGFDVKDDILWLKEKGIEFVGLAFDAAIAAYLLQPSRTGYDIEGLAFEFLGLAPQKKQNEEDNGQFFLNFDDEKPANDFYGWELFALFNLWKNFDAKIEENKQHSLYYDVELPLVEVLADMQYTGVLVDKEALEEFGNGMTDRISELEGKICGYAGRKFNVKSPKQLGVVLFEDLQLPHGKKTKTGYSTDVDVLKKLQGVHPIIDDILEYRALTKLQSTYVEGMLAVINSETGRIHSNFKQTVTATGRISSTEPNLQNIPVRTERGREMRRMFVAEGNRVLIDADYSQIELRVLAHIADDENMKNAFLSGADIHTQTAAQVFGVPVSEVTSSMRSGAKAVNFGIVYGIGEFSLSQDLKISIKEAKQYIENYLNTYPSIKKYMENIVESGKALGYVSTLMNRRRYIPELRASNKITQSFGERVALNAPVQGSAADIIKIAMVNVFKRLRAEGLNSKLILQVHDELIVEAMPDEVEKATKILVSEMEKAMKLSVPLKVDCNTGKTWYETK
ncbi:MAG: DNA polymerase I [Ruminococcaceae bacterium]|nr:DNA polymerase I [Oscillospiraceae bacterium]